MNKIYICLAFAIMFLTASCDREEFNSDNSIPEIPTVEGNLRESPYTFGAAVSATNLKNSEKYRQTVINEMSRITPENEMKMNTISLGKGRYDFTNADYIVDFAQQYGLQVHGHTLLWYKHTPSWISNYQGDSAVFVGLMKEYIYEVVGRYKGKVVSWDVVNEAVNDKGEVYQTDGTKTNIWMQKIGIDYIEMAFRFAHEADPDALLFYNDYGHEYSHQRRLGINNLVNDLKEKGAPIHGIGMQMHTNIGRSTSDLRNAIMLMAGSTKVKIHVSELDIALNTQSSASFELTDELLEQQQIWYRAVSKAMTDLPKDQQFGITFWGVSDANSWLSSTPDWPLPFNDKYERKPAYQGLLQGFKVK